jgi:hypothetical protein
MEMAVAVGVGEASVGEIDLVNIRQATPSGDGRVRCARCRFPRFSRWWTAMMRRRFPASATHLIGGDGRSLSIAAALDRRQGDAGPVDDAASSRASRLQLVQQQGIRHAGTLFRTQAAWRDRASSPQLRADPRDPTGAEPVPEMSVED